MNALRKLLEYPSQITYLSGASNYTWMQMQDGERHLFAKSLRYFEEQLPSFIRVHKATLINFSWVASIEPPFRSHAPGIVRMQDGTTFSISRHRWIHLSRCPPLDSYLAGALKLSPVVDAGMVAVPEEPSRLELAATLPMLVVMAGEALLLTRHHIQMVYPLCQLRAIEFGVSLTNSLLLIPAREWPRFILLDARTEKADRVLALKALKHHERLRAIPVVWLAAPEDDPMLGYELKANSVVVVAGDTASFEKAVASLCRYWLATVHLPG